MKVRAVDVAAYILRTKGSLEGKKLQKLVYYTQCRSLALFDQPLFEDAIQAWRHGPVVPELYGYHRYLFQVDPAVVRGNVDALDQQSRTLIDDVLTEYGGLTTAQLIDRTHCESPWQEAREGLRPEQSGNTVITHESMRRFYRSRMEGDVLTNSSQSFEIPKADSSQENFMLSNILRRGRLQNFSQSAILDAVADQVSSSQRLEGVDVSSSDVRKILDGRLRP